MKQQVIVIHGGDTFETYSEYIAFLKSFELDFARMRHVGWKQNLARDLGSEYEVVAPSMPNDSNAKYLEWKIWMDKLVPHINDNAIFVGHSLGGIFLAKYLTENNLKTKIRALFLVAPPFDAEDSEYTLADFISPDNLPSLQDKISQIFIYHSTDDDVVPFKDSEKYVKILAKAKLTVFKDRGHFNQETFPELVADIKKL